MELKSGRKYSTNLVHKVKTTPLVIHGLGGVHTHTCNHIFAHQNDLKKLGMRWPQAGAHPV